MPQALSVDCFVAYMMASTFCMRGIMKLWDSVLRFCFSEFTGIK